MIQIFYLCCINKNVNKSVICGQTQDTTVNTQPNKDETVIFEQTQDTQPDCVNRDS